MLRLRHAFPAIAALLAVHLTLAGYCPDCAAQSPAAESRPAGGTYLPPKEIGDEYRFFVETPDESINHGAELAVEAFWKGARKKAGILVPTVCGEGHYYPYWIHPYDNYWMNQVTSFLFPRESTEWPIRLFAVYQSPEGEIAGGVYHIPETDWRKQWEAAGGPVKWQGKFAQPLADYLAEQARNPAKVRHGIYVRDHLFVLQVYDQWRERGSLPFLIEMYGPCRRALKFLEQYHDLDHNGLIETTCVLSDLVVAGDRDINSTERSEDQVMLYGALRAFADMARQLGGVEDAAWAEGWATKVKEGLNKYFWRPEGRYMFGVERVGKKPRLEYVTTTYTNGYAILFGLTDDKQTTAILDWMAKQQFVVPGPYHIPPVRLEDKPQHPPGVYCNGGCGWGRGIMPSVALACYRSGRPDQGFDYLRRQGAAACKAGSFYEYWTWEKYAGQTKPGGSPWYCETSAGFLDVLLHGLFGISSPEPGFRSLCLAPQFPRDWPRARLEIRLPNGTRLELHYQADAKGKTLKVHTTPPLPTEVVLDWPEADKPAVTGSGLTASRCKQVGSRWQAVGTLSGEGEMRLEPGLK